VVRRRLPAWSSSTLSQPSRCLATSVTDARKAIFGWWQPEGAASTPFTALNRLRRRGWIGPKVASYYPKQNPMMRHPLVRRHLHDEWADEVETKSKMGKGPPKKGQGKRASRKK